MQACHAEENLPDSKFHGPNMGPTRVLSALDGPHVGPMHLAVRATTPWYPLSTIHPAMICLFHKTWRKLHLFQRPTSGIHVTLDCMCDHNILHHMWDLIKPHLYLFCFTYEQIWFFRSLIQNWMPFWQASLKLRGVKPIRYRCDIKGKKVKNPAKLRHWFVSEDWYEFNKTTIQINNTKKHIMYLTYYMKVNPLSCGVVQYHRTVPTSLR